MPPQTRGHLCPTLAPAGECTPIIALAFARAWLVFYAFSHRQSFCCHLRFRQSWDSLILIAVIYCSFVVPWDMCFQPSRGSELVAIDVIVEVHLPHRFLRHEPLPSPSHTTPDLLVPHSTIEPLQMTETSPTPFLLRVYQVHWHAGTAVESFLVTLCASPLQIIFMVDIVFNFMTSFFDSNVDEVTMIVLVHYAITNS